MRHDWKLRRIIARAILTAVGTLSCCVATGTAQAQAYPAKPVRIVVPFAPGGPNDILARVIGQKLTESWGQQVFVENRAGGGTVIGTEVVAKSPPDGYNLLMVSTSHTTNPTLVRKLPFDTLRDLAPVIKVAYSSNVLLAHPSLPARSVKEFIAVARARPDQVTYASGGNGTSTHLSGEMLAQMSGAKMVHVPYKGAGPANIALISGEITCMFGNAIPSVPLIRSGRLRALAVTGMQRNPALPDVPTLADTLPGFEATSWYGVSVQGATPKDVIAKLNQDIGRLLNTSDMRSRLATEGAEAGGGSPEEFGAYFRAEIDKWAKVIKAAGIRLE
ncbi:MAG TPA: tripartite tricarboxylate transporter substrate binding protein [Burkholderiales bacterium]|nr:tripartite tricarboxylate transporter substrate binding protein [Burkholderiales bacterium]